MQAELTSLTSKNLQLEREIQQKDEQIDSQTELHETKIKEKTRQITCLESQQKRLAEACKDLESEVESMEGKHKRQSNKQNEGLDKK